VELISITPFAINGAKGLIFLEARETDIPASQFGRKMEIQIRC